jgi:hypothetical protein
MKSGLLCSEALPVATITNCDMYNAAVVQLFLVYSKLFRFQSLAIVNDRDFNINLNINRRKLHESSFEDAVDKNIKLKHWLVADVFAFKE